MLTASLARFSRSLVENRHFNGHPDLIVRGVYPNDAVQAGEQGVEIKSTRKSGGAVDTHGARKQWMCVFVYTVDNETQPAANRRPMRFVEVYLGEVEETHFRANPRKGQLGTRTATLDKDGIQCAAVPVERRRNPPHPPFAGTQFLRLFLRVFD